MRNKLLTTLASVVFLFLSGCNQLTDLQEAVSGINTAADKAAKATMVDIHSLRSMEINYENRNFTINTLFTTILRDVQWDYEEKEDLQILFIKGSYKDSLFVDHQFSEETKKNLKEHGQIFIELTIENHQIIAEETTMKLILNQDVLFEKSGEISILNMYDYYISLNK